MSASRARPDRGSSGGRLLARPPRVYVGPDATGALAGEWGVLRGAKRAQWVDVLDFTPCARPRGSVAELRFRTGAGWSVVGLSLPQEELDRRRASLLRELVPGDLVITERGARVHLGDEWAPARMIRDAPRSR